MEIKGFLPSTFIDYPGKVAAVIWTPGCNLRCPICYNIDLVLNKPGLPCYPEERIIAHLKKERDFLDGLVITGGEPTLQSDLLQFVKKIKTAGFLVKLDTNGTNPMALRELLKEKLLDFVALDIKGPPDAEKFSFLTGISPQAFSKILSSVITCVDLLLDSGVEYEIRTTVAPNSLQEDDFVEISRLLKSRTERSLFPGRYVIQNFFSAPTLNPEFATRKPWEKERLCNLQKKLQPYFREVIIRDR